MEECSNHKNIVKGWIYEGPSNPERCSSVKNVRLNRWHSCSNTTSETLLSAAAHRDTPHPGQPRESTHHATIFAFGLPTTGAPSSNGPNNHSHLYNNRYQYRGCVPDNDDEHGLVGVNNEDVCSCVRMAQYLSKVFQCHRRFKNTNVFFRSPNTPGLCECKLSDCLDDTLECQGLRVTGEDCNAMPPAEDVPGAPLPTDQPTSPANSDASLPADASASEAPSAWMPPDRDSLVALSPTEEPYSPSSPLSQSPSEAPPAAPTVSSANSLPAPALSSVWQESPPSATPSVPGGASRELTSYTWDCVPQ